MVLPNLASVVNTDILRGAERQAAAEGYVLLIADSIEFGPASAAYQRLLMEGRVDGLLLGSASARDGGLDALTGPTPVVLINRRPDNQVGLSVSVDDERGVSLAVDHLVELGHTNICHIAGPKDVDTARRRRAGFVDRMNFQGIDVKGSRIVSSTLSESSGYEAMTAMLGRKSRPTAVIAWSFATAIGAMSAVGNAGLRVPHDMSIIGFHDAPIADYLNPPLTTIRMPLAAMAERSVTTLVRMIEGEEVADVVVQTPEPELIVRRSTAPLGQTSA
jgi:LacI family transcriptional regulator